MEKTFPKGSVVADCIALSDGTLSTLTGYRNTGDLEILQRKFVDFAIEGMASAPKAYDTWMSAWKWFEKTYVPSNKTAKNMFKWCKDPSKLFPQ